MAKEKKFITCDGNTAAAHVSYMFTEVAAKDGQFELVSCIELNLRRTMGHVALELAKIAKPQSLMRVDFDGNRYHLRVLPGNEAVNES